MTIHAVFEHQDGYRFNQVYATRGQFLRSLNAKNCTFINGMDTDRSAIIYPSSLPEYRKMP